MTAPMFTNAWTTSQVVMPVAMRVPNRSLARMAVRMPSTARATKRAMTSVAPTRPSSSPMIEKMKSV